MPGPGHEIVSASRLRDESIQLQHIMLCRLALQLRFLRGSESMGNHDSKIVDAGSVD
jgi:hypothetical protein